MGFSKQEHWSGMPFPPPGDLPDPGIQPVSQVSCIGKQILYHEATWEATDKFKQLLFMEGEGCTYKGWAVKK